MASNLTWYELAELDDFLTASVVDSLFYWATIRKANPYLLPFEPLSSDETLKLVRNHMTFPKDPSSSETKRLNLLIPCFLRLKKVRQFLSRYPHETKIRDFVSHARRYFLLYSQECGFDICCTDRYFSRSNKLEACVVAKKVYQRNEEVKYLNGCLAQLDEDELSSLEKNDFSVINISSRSLACLMLGPTRFVNHDCNGNAKFSSTRKGMAIVAVRKILVGEEITVAYAANYFGKNNRDCLCATCEFRGLGAFAPREVRNSKTQEGKEVPAPSSDGILTEFVELDDSDSDSEIEEIIVIDGSGNYSLSMSPNMYSDMRDSDDDKSVYELGLEGDTPVVSEEPHTFRLNFVPDELMEPEEEDDDDEDEELSDSEAEALKFGYKQLCLGIGGRPRRIKLLRLDASSSTILDFYPLSDSPDSLKAWYASKTRKEIRQGNIIEFTQRTLFRTFQSLYNKFFYDPEYLALHTVRDCVICGNYFEPNLGFVELLKLPANPSQTVKDYCPRCLRHYKVFKLAWPITRVELHNGNYHSLRQFVKFSKLPPREQINNLLPSSPPKVKDIDLKADVRARICDVNFVFSDIADLKLGLRNRHNGGVSSSILSVNSSLLMSLFGEGNHVPLRFSSYRKNELRETLSQNLKLYRPYFAQIQRKPKVEIIKQEIVKAEVEEKPVRKVRNSLRVKQEHRIVKRIKLNVKVGPGSSSESDNDIIEGANFYEGSDSDDDDVQILLIAVGGLEDRKYHQNQVVGGAIEYYQLD